MRVTGKDVGALQRRRHNWGASSPPTSATTAVTSFFWKTETLCVRSPGRRIFFFFLMGGASVVETQTVFGKVQRPQSVFISRFQCKLANTFRIRGKKLFNAPKLQITLCHCSHLEMTARLNCMLGGFMKSVYILPKWSHETFNCIAVRGTRKQNLFKRLEWNMYQLLLQPFWQLVQDILRSTVHVRAEGSSVIGCWSRWHGPPPHHVSYTQLAPLNQEFPTSVIIISSVGKRSGTQPNASVWQVNNTASNVSCFTLNYCFSVIECVCSRKWFKRLSHLNSLMFGSFSPAAGGQLFNKHFGCRRAAAF